MSTLQKISLNIIATITVVLGSANLHGNCDQCKKVLDEFHKLMHEYINVSKELRAHVKDNVDYSKQIRKLHGD